MLGIFGGTFDPVHLGHIKPALSVKAALKLDQLRFIPNRIPPHRTKPWLSVDQRLALLHTALAEYPDVVVDRRELERDGPSYMIDTLRSFKADFPQQGICLIIGMDAFFGITKWHQWRALFELCHLVVTTRPGFDASEIKTRVSSEDYEFLAQKLTTDLNALSTQAAGIILLQSVPQLDISSTLIREKLLKNEDISEWLPEGTNEQLRGFILHDNR